MGFVILNQTTQRTLKHKHIYRMLFPKKWAISPFSDRPGMALLAPGHLTIRIMKAHIVVLPRSARITLEPSAFPKANIATHVHSRFQAATRIFAAVMVNHAVLVAVVTVAPFLRASVLLTDFRCHPRTPVNQR
jgi:hypothetical protein